MTIYDLRFTLYDFTACSPRQRADLQCRVSGTHAQPRCAQPCSPRPFPAHTCLPISGEHISAPYADAGTASLQYLRVTRRAHPHGGTWSPRPFLAHTCLPISGEHISAPLADAGTASLQGIDMRAANAFPLHITPPRPASLYAIDKPSAIKKARHAPRPTLYFMMTGCRPTRASAPAPAPAQPAPTPPVPAAPLPPTIPQSESRHTASAGRYSLCCRGASG